MYHPGPPGVTRHPSLDQLTASTLSPGSVRFVDSLFTISEITATVLVSLTDHMALVITFMM